MGRNHLEGFVLNYILQKKIIDLIVPISSLTLYIQTYNLFITAYNWCHSPGYQGNGLQMVPLTWLPG